MVEENFLLPAVQDVVKELNGNENWVDLAIIGKKLTRKGVSIKSQGFSSLKDFFVQNDAYFEVKIDNTYKVPVAYVKMRKAKPCNSSSDNRHINTYSPQSPKLRDWAYIPNFSEAINSLRKLALLERWYYKVQNQANPYPILAKYLTFTFTRLAKEKGKILETPNYATFNTGLVNNLYCPIYALFNRNKNSFRQKWYFLGFCVEGIDTYGKELVRTFNSLPERAHYFQNPAELIYDSKAPMPRLDWDHIILENVRRLPVDFLNDNISTIFQMRDTSEMNTIEQTEYYDNMRIAIESNPQVFRAIKNRFADSLDTALKKVEWNFKTAIPMYYPKRNSISLLLPLSLTMENKIDLALVTEKTASRNYLGHTILPLEWAYSNARLITRPDSDWLVAAEIESPDSEVLEDDFD